MKSADLKSLLAITVLLTLLIFAFSVWYDWKHTQGWLLIDGVIGFILVFAGIVLLKFGLREM